MKTIIIYGLKRSGNHFLISTILQQFTNFVHINNACDLKLKDYEHYKNVQKSCERIDHVWTGFKDVECILISLENTKIDFNLIEEYKKEIDNCYIIQLLRFPYGNFCSIWKVYNNNKERLLEIVELWKIYAKIFINKGEQIIPVLYDKFSTDNNYIINFFKKLNIDNVKINKSIQIKYQESSFKDKSKVGEIFNTIENCIYKDDKIFLELVDDKEVCDLYKSLINLCNHFM